VTACAGRPEGREAIRAGPIEGLGSHWGGSARAAPGPDKVADINGMLPRLDGVHRVG